MDVLTKPILFLDVDGVLNPDSKPRFLKPLGFKRYRIWDDSGYDRYTVWLNKSHGDWLKSLTDVVDIVWATTWNHHANRAIAGRIGLPQLPVALARPRGHGRTWDKTEGILEYAKGRSFIWVDDVMTGDDIRNLKIGTDAKFDLIRPTPYHGLQMNHITQIRLWIELLER